MKKLLLSLQLLIFLAGSALAINPPVISISPDTIDGSGIVTIEVTVDDANNTFSSGYLAFASPVNFYWNIENFVSYDITGNKLTYTLQVDSFDTPGFYHISEMLKIPTRIRYRLY